MKLNKKNPLYEEDIENIITDIPIVLRAGV